MMACSVSLCEVRLRAVLVNFGFSKNIRIFSKYHHMDLKMEIFEEKKKNCLTSRSVSLLRVRLRAVLANFGFLKIKFSDSAQC